ncbi:MAG: protein translocase subunit SecD [Lachnospiraceae bacterium]|nr:protein translocase subunit SecD [Lachnospiraceae bacterium]
MKKNKGILSLVVTVILIGVLGFTSAVGWGNDHTGAAKNIKLGLDLAGGVSITYQVKDENPSESEMKDTIYKLQKRVEQYSTESSVYQEGDDRINIEIPGVSNANEILDELGQPGSLYFIAQTGSDGTPNYEQVNSTGDAAKDYQLKKSLEELEADGSLVLTGSDVKSAKAETMENQTTKAKENIVSLVFTKDGTKKFADATTKAFEAQESIGIYYDGSFVSVPNVNNAIENGEAQITGSMSFEEADALASTIRIGGLKLELEELRSNVVGAQLGEQAISTSLKAGAIGLAIVFLFMIFVYYLPGLASGLALLIYTELVIVILNAFNVTLTLPGIAGIILGIGMAVDANVIIFARVKEEMERGKSVRNALKTGFQKAMSAIVDGNVTTLIAAAVLWVKGSGTVKGFAQTLAIGIIVSMFTALVITRMIIYAFYAVGLRSEKLYYRPRKKERTTIPFLAKRKLFIGISLVVIIAGVAFMGVNASRGKGAFAYSLEFQGGTSTNVTFNKDYSIDEIDKEIVPILEEVTGDANVQTQKVAGTNQVIIKTVTLDLAKREALNKALVDNFGVDESKITAENISSTVSNEMRQDAIIAVIVATICMLLYIWFRFKDIRFATSAVTALLHDVLVVLTFYAIARIAVGNTFIACMLTIVGYSINATIVIFDRIREELRLKTKTTDLEEVVNKSITWTLTRSIYTSLTTFVMVAVLFVMGVSSIKEFAAPLMVGIICGAYSSVCITGALWYIMKTKIGKKTA